MEDAHADKPMTTATPNQIAGVSPFRCLVFSLLAGLLAALISGLGGESINGRFIPPLMATSGFPSIEEAQAAANARTAGIRLEATLRAVMLGASLGLLLGLAAGGTTKSVRPIASFSLLGFCSGGLAAGAATWSLVPVFYGFYDPDKDVLLQTLLIHGTIAMIIGGAVGLPFALGLQSSLNCKIPGLIRQTVIGGMLGALAGSLIFQIFGMILFPLDQTNLPISKSTISRLTSNLLIALMSSAGICKATLSVIRMNNQNHDQPTTG
jgi:hypothetical protein